MQPLPIAVIPSGPSTFLPESRYTELNPVDQDGVALPGANLSTFPVWVMPPAPGPATPDSDTYMLPMPSKAIPRGDAKPPTTGAIVVSACAAAGASRTTATATSAATGTMYRCSLPSCLVVTNRAGNRPGRTMSLPPSHTRFGSNDEAGNRKPASLFNPQPRSMGHPA